MVAGLIERYRRHETLINVVAFGFAIYLAAANVLKGAKFPDEPTWQPWTGWFIGILAASLVVPIFALLKALDAQQQKRDKESAEHAAEESELDADIARLCQEIAAELARACPDLRLDDVAVQVWLCDDATDRFHRRWRFFLPVDRTASGIEWRKGLGVAGTAWKQGRNLSVSLDAIRRLSPREFDALPDERRYGMTYDQVQATRAYTGVIAVRLFSADTGEKLLGMLVIDYTGSGGFGCVSSAMANPSVSRAVGACARRLAGATFLRSEDL